MNTFLPIIVPNFFSNAYNVFLMRQFITRIPGELDESAMLDGLGHLGVFRRIILPMLTPVLIAIGIFTLTFTWGDFMGPLIYINSEEKMPLALGIQYIATTSQARADPAVEPRDGRLDPAHPPDDRRVLPRPALPVRDGPRQRKRGGQVT